MRKVKAKPKANGKPGVAPLPRKTAKLLRKLMEEQGVVGKNRIENFLGKGRDLWKSDEDFENFLKILAGLRHPEREYKK